MSDSDVDICNEGLSHLGISEQIQSFDEGSAAADACSFWYPKCLDRQLKRAPWDFAFTSTVLASDASQVGPLNGNSATQPLPGWSSAYQYPSDCLQAIALSPPGGMRYASSYWSGYWGWGNRASLYLPKVPYKVVQSLAQPGQRMIVCDLPPSQAVYLMYIQRVTDLDIMDDLFKEALGFYVGARVGRALRSNIQRIGELEQQWTMKLREAQAQAMNQAQQDPAPDSPSISVR